MIPTGRCDSITAMSEAASADPREQYGQAFGVRAINWQVVDISAGIPGAYATKVLADAGARVVKFESPDGDPLRRWAAGGHVVPEGEMGALFSFLSCSKESVVVDVTSEPDLARARQMVSRADLIVWSPEGPLAGVDDFDPVALRKHAPTATVVAITPFGLSGPWSDLPASELTLQAWTGAAGRGLPSEPPRTIGGYLGEWIGGVFAAVGGALSRLRPDSPHSGEIVDIALLETLAFCQWNHEVTFYEMASRPWHPHRTVNVPDIEPTKDGFVGFMVVTAQMWQDFCCMINHPEWLEDESLYTYKARFARRDELVKGIREWTSQKTTSEILEIAGAFRVPAAPLGDGASIPLTEHFLAEGLFVKNPGSGFLQPAVPYRLGSNVPTAPLRPAPRLGEHNAEDDAAGAGASAAVAPSLRGQGGAPSRDLPLAGLRVADFTSFWAGPLVSQALAMFGAEVIHIESPGHPDGFRGHTTKTDRDDLWWEWTPPFHASNTNKLGLTLDMTRPECREIAAQLISKSDIVIDNFSPRVMEQWGFGYDEVKRLREDIIMLRMPAFGLTGPWRNRNGFGPTMEQASGMSFLTGFPDGSPTSLLGPCDPIAGAHALFSLLLAIQHRRETGEGMLVEAIMVASALNVAAEQVITHSAYGTVLTRTGNKGYRPGFQNLFACADREPNGDVRWVAIAASTERQIAALMTAVRGSASMEDARSALRSPADLDQFDSQVSEWCALRTSSEIITALWPAGVTVAKVLLPHELREIEQLQYRRFFERVDHPITGVDTIARLPMRLSRGPDVFHRIPAPTLGEHNRKILSELLDIPVHEIEQLESDHSIGTRIVGHFRSR